MTTWPDRRLLDLFGIDIPIVQAPMAGETTPELAAAVSEAGGLGSLGCATFSCEDVHNSVRRLRELTNKPFNLNFFCHHDPAEETEKRAAWILRLKPFYDELGIEPPDVHSGPRRKPFSIEMADCLDDLAPPVVSFHFGCPRRRLSRISAPGAARSSARQRRRGRRAGSHRRAPTPSSPKAQRRVAIAPPLISKERKR